MSHLNPDLGKGRYSWDELVAKEVELSRECITNVGKLEHLMSHLDGEEADKIALKKLVKDVWGSFSLRASLGKSALDSAQMDLSSAQAAGEVLKRKYEALEKEHDAFVRTRGKNAAVPKQILALTASHRKELQECQIERDEALQSLNELQKVLDDENKVIIEAQLKKNVQSSQKKVIYELERKDRLAAARLPDSRTIAIMQDTFETAKMNLEAEKNSLQEEIVTLQLEKTSIFNKNTTLKQEIATLKKEKDSSDNHYIRLKDTLSPLQEEIAILRREKTSILDKNITLKQEMAILKKEKDSSDNHYTRLKDTLSHSLSVRTGRIETLEDKVAAQSAEAVKALEREAHYKDKIDILERNPEVAECLIKLDSLEYVRTAHNNNLFKYGNTAEEREATELHIQAIDSEINELKKTVFQSRKIDFKGKYDLVAQENADFGKRELKYVQFTKQATQEIDSLTTELVDAHKQLRAYKAQGNSERTGTGKSTGTSVVDDGTLSTKKTPDHERWQADHERWTADVIKGFVQQVATKQGAANVVANRLSGVVNPFHTVQLHTTRDQALAQERSSNEKATTDNTQGTVTGGSTFEKTPYGSTKRSASPGNGGGGKRFKVSAKSGELTPEGKQELMEMNICVLHYLGKCTMKKCHRFHMDKRVVDPLVAMLLNA